MTEQILEEKYTHFGALDDTKGLENDSTKFIFLLHSGSILRYIYVKCEKQMLNDF